jgi:hypothetical protein
MMVRVLRLLVPHVQLEKSQLHTLIETMVTPIPHPHLPMVATLETALKCRTPGHSRERAGTALSLHLRLQLHRVSQMKKLLYNLCDLVAIG